MGQEQDLSRILVVDVETTEWEPPESRPFGEVSEIIEIGYALLDVASGDVVQTGATYVQPEFSSVSDFITKLTGIRAATLQAAPIYPKAMTWLRHEIPGLALIPWASWGDYDREMFEAMARLHLPRYTDPYRSRPLSAPEPRLYPFGRTHLNVRVLYNLAMRQRGLGERLHLHEALERSGRPFLGVAHHAEDDARNAALLLADLLGTLRGMSRPPADPEVPEAAVPHGELNPYGLLIALELAGWRVPRDKRDAWTPEEQRAVLEWAHAEHLAASDLPVERLPRPAVVDRDGVRVEETGEVSLPEPPR